MFLKSLKISNGDKIIREIIFKKGINLIVDETPEINDKATGNNVGKTTVLKLIDFCLGGSAKMVYSDPESKKDVYELVKDFLISNGILITLILKEDLENLDSKEIVIERNFRTYKKKIQTINGDNFTDDEFELKLLSLIIPEQNAEKPTFRQIISHNIRYKDDSINNTIKTLDRYTSDAEYEALYLFLFGCEFNEGASRQEILEKIKLEKNFKIRLEKKQTKTAYNTALALIDSEIEDIEKRKKFNFSSNDSFETQLSSLNEVKYEINKISSEISKITIRKDLIIEAEQELNSKKSDIDLNQLRLIYQQATEKINGIQKTFDDLVSYHNKMLIEKIQFIKKDLPKLEKDLKEKQGHLKVQLNEEKRLTSELTKSTTFEDLEELILESNEKFRKKGEYESVIKQLEEVEKNIKDYSVKLEEIDVTLFSDEFEETVKTQLNKFNKHFALISHQLYGEKYIVNYDIVLNKQNQKLYKFTAFNANLSSGKKQGEISCFDIAYTMFADEENISCLHFLLNDKKELMHDNQLVKIAEFVNDNNIQFLASILKDKLPEELNKEEYFAVKLSQEDKLFKLEKFSVLEIDTH